MLEKVEALTAAMVSQSPNLRIAFNEADGAKTVDMSAQRFLKVNETRLGRDFALYALMAKAATEQAATVTLLEELVLPLKKTEPDAYMAGLSYLREQGPVFGENKGEWENVIDSLKPN